MFLVCLVILCAQDYTLKMMTKLLELKSDPDKADAVKAVFKENLIDVNNPTHLEGVADDINEKIIGRFFK